MTFGIPCRVGGSTSPEAIMRCSRLVGSDSGTMRSSGLPLSVNQQRSSRPHAGDRPGRVAVEFAQSDCLHAFQGTYLM